VDRGPVAGTRLVDHGGTEPPGHLGRSVERPVVDDDRPEAVRDRTEHEREGSRLVPARDDDVADDRALHASTVEHAFAATTCNG
jgi:hypothetical protein